jgi:PIN domain nuclease of toxin-antitoxin system
MQQYILDTHTLIWFIDGDKQLSQTARTSIEGDNVINYVSIGSLWEIAIKISLKKLELKTSFDQINRQLIENGFELLPVTFADTLTISNLPFHHRDPFDRMIIAQALNSGIGVITKDENFSLYDVKVIW